MSDPDKKFCVCCCTLFSTLKRKAGRKFRCYVVETPFDVDFINENREAITAQKKNKILNVQISIGDLICGACYAQKSRRKRTEELQQQTSSDESVFDDNLPCSSQQSIRTENIRSRSLISPPASSSNAADFQASTSQLEESVSSSENESMSSDDDESREIIEAPLTSTAESGDSDSDQDISSASDESEHNPITEAHEVTMNISSESSSSENESSPENEDENSTESNESSSGNNAENVVEDNDESTDNNESTTDSNDSPTDDEEEEYSDSESYVHNDNRQNPDEVEAGPSNSTNIKRSLAGHCSCVFRCHPHANLKRIPIEKRTICLAESNVFIPDGARCCSRHFTMGDDIWSTLIPVSGSRLSTEEYEEAVELLRRPFARQFLSRSFPTLTPENSSFYKNWTGLDPEQFISLMESSGIIRNEQNAKYLAMTLIKLRKNLSYDDLASLTGLCRSTIINNFDKYITILSTRFASQYLGFGHLSREQALTNNTQIANALFDVPPSNLVVVADGTYFATQKSMNADAGRRLYSMQKLKHLFKPFIICCANGYIIHVECASSAADNDATILKHIIRSNRDARHFFQDGDVFILDRGFSDCLSFLQSKNFITHMPRSKPRRASQLSTDDANYSRKVTKVRYVIECINGMLKGQFKICRETWQNKSLLKVNKVVRTCCALLNAFRSRLESDVGYQMEIIDSMLSRENRQNKLKLMVEHYNLNLRRANFEERNVDEVHSWFTTEIGMDDLYFLAAGTYQLKYCASYLHDTRRGNNDGILFELYTHPDDNEDIFAPFFIECDGPLLLRAKLRSRHRREKEYFIFVILDTNKTGVERISEYYCTCLAGSRTLGCCCHVLTVIWYGAIGSIRTPPVPAAHLESFARRISELSLDINDTSNDA